MTTDTIFQGDVNSNTGEPMWEFICPLKDSRRGVEFPCKFVSHGWATYEQAQARGRQHMHEHLVNLPMAEEMEFMRQYGMADSHEAFPEVPDDKHQAFPEEN